MARQGRPTSTKTPPKKRKRVIASSSDTSDSDLVAAPQPVHSSPAATKRPKKRLSKPSELTISVDKMYNFSSPARPAQADVSAQPRRNPRTVIVNPRHGVKLIKVKNQRKGFGEENAEIYYHEVLVRIGPVLDAILRDKKDLPCSTQELYQRIRIVCMQEKSERLYAVFLARMQKHALEAVVPRMHAQLKTVAALPCVLEERRLWKSQWVSLSYVEARLTT
jgi:hypothetical protein